MTDYMTVDTTLPPYFPYPQFLMDMALSHTAALTYALLLDRAHLSLIIREMQIKTNLRFLLTPVRMAKIKNSGDSRC